MIVSVSGFDPDFFSSTYIEGKGFSEKELLDKEPRISVQSLYYSVWKGMRRTKLHLYAGDAAEKAIILGIPNRIFSIAPALITLICFIA
ncbi:hypothetical protein ABNC51_18120 [Paenibacillus larvae]